MLNGKEIWRASRYSDLWEDTSTFDSRMDAFILGPKALGLEIGDVFYIGREVHPIPQIDIQQFIHDAQHWASKMGQYAWLDGVTDIQLVHLEEHLKDAFCDWLDVYGYYPDWVMVTQIETGVYSK